jgi:hypothetical protein
MFEMLQRWKWKFEKPPELYQCKCGSGLSRQTMVTGISTKTGIKMQIRCRDCKRLTTIKGDGPNKRWIYLQIRNNTRPSYRDRQADISCMA